MQQHSPPLPPRRALAVHVAEHKEDDEVAALTSSVGGIAAAAASNALSPVSALRPAHTRALSHMQQRRPSVESTSFSPSSGDARSTATSITPRSGAVGNSGKHARHRSGSVSRGSGDLLKSPTAEATPKPTTTGEPDATLQAEVARFQAEIATLKHRLVNQARAHEADQATAVAAAVDRERVERERRLKAAAVASQNAVRQAQDTMNQAFEKRFNAYQATLGDHQLLMTTKMQQQQVRELASQITLQEMMLAVQRNEIHALERQAAEAAANTHSPAHYEALLAAADLRHAKALSVEQRQRAEATQAHETTHELMKVYMHRCDDSDSAMARAAEEHRSKMIDLQQSLQHTRHIAQSSFAVLSEQYQQSATSWSADRADLFQQFCRKDDVITRQDESINRLLFENAQLLRQLQSLGVFAMGTQSHTETAARITAERQSIGSPKGGARSLTISTSSSEASTHSFGNVRLLETTYKPVLMPPVAMDVFAFAASLPPGTITEGHTPAGDWTPVVQQPTRNESPPPMPQMSPSLASASSPLRYPSSPSTAGTPPPPGVVVHRSNSQQRVHSSLGLGSATPDASNSPPTRHARISSRGPAAEPTPTLHASSHSVSFTRAFSDSLGVAAPPASVDDASNPPLLPPPPATIHSLLHTSSSPPAAAPIATPHGLPLPGDSISGGGSGPGPFSTGSVSSVLVVGGASVPKTPQLAQDVVVGISQEWRSYQNHKTARDAAKPPRNVYPDLIRERNEREIDEQLRVEHSRQQRTAALLAEGDLNDYQRPHPPAFGSASSRSRPSAVLHHVSLDQQLIIPAPLATPEELHTNRPAVGHHRRLSNDAGDNDDEPSPYRPRSLHVHGPAAVSLTNGLSDRANTFISQALQSSMPIAYTGHTNSSGSKVALTPIATLTAGVTAAATPPTYINNSISAINGGSLSARARDLRGKRVKQYAMPRSGPNAPTAAHPLSSLVATARVITAVAPIVDAQA